MLELILEKPWTVGGMGAILTIVATQWWISSGRREAIQIAIATLLATLILVAISVLVETEQETLRAMLYKTADDLQNNRKDDVLSVIYGNPTAPVVDAKHLLSEGVYVFDVAVIKKLHSVEISGPKSARRALVKINVFVEGRFGNYAAKIPRYVELTLYLEGDRWLVYDFTHDEPFAGFKIDP